MNRKIVFGVIALAVVSGIFFLSRQSTVQEIVTVESTDRANKPLNNHPDGSANYTETKAGNASSSGNASAPSTQQQNQSVTRQDSIPPVPLQDQASNQGNAVAGAASSERKLMVVDLNARLQHQYAFDQEARDEAWATPTEQSIKDTLLNNQYAARYKIEELGCKTTVCVIKASVEMNKTNPDMERDFGWSNIMKSLRNTPLGQNIQDAEIAVSSDPKNPNLIIYETSFLKQ